ncbi:NACHT domain-containing protein [Favolaschia claudopus]|uniref:NACHT domain-containing protein n=1 Tax=Favolaschia claudopus TaxID=2862362 RepID=A0AAW0DWH2_9AGAR
MTFLPQSHQRSSPEAHTPSSGQQLNLSGGSNRYTGEDGLYILHSAIAIGASYDSIERYPPPRCHPQTRKIVFEIILSWTKNALHGPRVMWVCGAAGSGKSAISQTVSEYCAQSGQLGATFFFSHGNGSDLSDGKLLFPTIAYKLAGAIPGLRGPLSRAIQANTSILTQSLELQIQKLIVEPFSMIRHPPIPTLIVIDGLDACDSAEMQHRILTLIAQLLVVHRLPLCFFITSRLQSHLEATFDTPVYRKLSTRIPLDVFVSDNDVRTFLYAEFAAVRQVHQEAMRGIPHPWPSEDVIELIVQKSEGQFLYPATVLKYVDDNSGRPAERLTEIVVAAVSAADAEPSLSLSPTDQLCHHVLSTSPDPAALMRILGPLVVLFSPLPPTELEVLLSLAPGDVSLILRDMHALVDVPSSSASPLQRVRIPQPSTIEFLLDIHRSMPFWIEPGKYHAEIVRGCIRYIGEFMDLTMQQLDLRLYQYTRKKWTRHLALATPSPELLQDLCELRFVYSRVPAEVRDVITWLQSIPQAPMTQDVLELWQGWLTQIGPPPTAFFVP